MSLREERGFTLVEVTIAAALLVVGVLGVLTLLDSANTATARTKAREGGINLAREAIEAARAVPYPELVPSRIEPELKAQPGLADIAAEAGWDVYRRGILYTIVPSVCSVDDGTVALDGFGDHTGGFFCADSGTQGTADTNPDDYKRVAIDVTWKDGLRTRTARQEAVINNPGSAFAPAIKTLNANPVSPVTNPAVNAIGFTATTSSKATKVNWLLDNVERGAAGATSAAGTTWTFSWDITGIVDGTYLVSAEAFDQFGESGTGRVVTMQLNRKAPDPPTGLTGGRNDHFSFAEFEWDPNAERDVVGYRVYRMPAAAVVPSATDTAVCETSVEDDANPTTCRDTSIPADPLVRYYVVALAPARGAPGIEESARPGAAGVFTVGPNAAPSAPATVTATAGADGVVLNWTAASDSDGSIRYYRVYRDGNTYAGRLDRTGSGDDLTLSDPQGFAGRRYWVTAVDDQMAESDFAPPGGIVP